MNETTNGTNQELKSNVSEVSVFVDRARITRKSSLSVETGGQELTLVDLPLNLAPDTVRVKASGTARVKIRGVDLKKTFFKDVPPGKAKELTDRIQELEDKVGVLKDACESLDAQIRHIDGLFNATKTYAVGLAKGTVSPESHGSVMDFLTEKRVTAQTRLREQHVQRRQLELSLTKLKNELSQVHQLKPRSRYSAIVGMEVSQAGELDVELIYTMPGAYWKPVYDIRLTGEWMEIGYLGQVVQKTGEDWRGITLVLSTVSPARGTMIPELNPWYIAPFQPPRAMRSMAIGGAVPEAASPPEIRGKADIPAESELFEEDVVEIEEAPFIQAEVKQTGPSVTYAVTGKVDIPGDGSPHKTTITDFKLTPKSDFVTAPKMEEKAYRRVKAANESQLMLLPGTAQIFEYDNFIGSAVVEQTAPGQEITLYAGTDDRIRVERTLTARETDKKMMSDKRRIRFAYRIDLENHTGAEQTVTVRDQAPVSRHESIKVRLEGVEPKPRETDGLNRLEWELTLAANGKKTIVYEFLVEYPRDMSITGLP